MDKMRKGPVDVLTPLRKGDFIRHGGQEYQILKFLKAISTYLVYRVRNTQTHGVINIRVLCNFQVPAKEEDKDDYFQILGLDEEDKEVTLKSCLTGVERMIKVRWEEDVEVIKEGLMMEDKEMLCTLTNLMGKEVIGDFKFMPKDPPIMRMPDLVMDTIFSNLTPEDAFNARLVTPGWASLLPINKFVKCTSLKIFRGTDRSPNIVHAKFQPLADVKRKRKRASRGFKDDGNLVNLSANLENLQPLINACVLEYVEVLDMQVNPLWPRSVDGIQPISDHCHNIKEFTINDDNNEYENASLLYWIWAKKLILSNGKELRKLRISISSPWIRELDLLNDIKIRDCTSPQTLELVLSHKDSVLRNLDLQLQHIPASITSLTLIGPSMCLKKSHVLGIPIHFPQLTHTNLSVHHIHSDSLTMDEEDEVDENVMFQVFDTLRTLKYAQFYMGLPITERLNPAVNCGKMKMLGYRSRHRIQLIGPPQRRQYLTMISPDGEADCHCEAFRFQRMERA